MIIRRSTYNRLIARVDAYAAAARDARRVQQAAVNTTGRIAERSTTREAELTATTEQLRKELTSSQRLVRNQQAQLDELLGLNAPGVVAGAQWQDRRVDKRKEHTP